MQLIANFLVMWNMHAHMHAYKLINKIYINFFRHLAIIDQTFTSCKTADKYFATILAIGTVIIKSLINHIFAGLQWHCQMLCE